jgi:hypothetical protein
MHFVGTIIIYNQSMHGLQITQSWPTSCLTMWRAVQNAELVKGITLKWKLCQSLRIPQILNGVCRLITSQTPSEYICKNYDLTRLILDYQHIKRLSVKSNHYILFL